MIPKGKQPFRYTRIPLLTCDNGNCEEIGRYAFDIGRGRYVVYCENHRNDQSNPEYPYLGKLSDSEIALIMLGG